MTGSRMFIVLLLLAAVASAADQPQWGRPGCRNMVSDEKDLPDTFDPATSAGIKWVARLGGETNGVPVVAGGKVYVGTNNRAPRDERHAGDRGVLMCFNEADGKLLWQLVVPKLTSIKYGDWHYVGIASAPVVEGNRAYVVSNRCEVMCLDTAGLADGNVGPYRDEGRHMAMPKQPAMKTTDKDADIVWLFDMVAELGVSPHNASNCSVLVDGDLLYVCTSNGVEWTHHRPANPKAPSLIVIDKKTGKLVARDDTNIGPNIFHGQWSSPALGRVGERRLVFFGAGDGVCYAFEALSGRADKLKTVWSFKCDPAGKKVAGGASLWPADPNGPSTIVGMPVFHKNRIYLAATGDPWHGKRAGGVHCIDATGSGDITKTGRVWSNNGIGQCVSTISVADGLVYVASYRKGNLYCLDAATGKPHWVHNARGPMLGSTLVADGKVHVGTTRGDFWILAAGKEKKIVRHVRFPSGINTTPTAANGRLYVATTKRLYAIGPVGR